MSRKKHDEAPHEEHADETWLIPYSDLLTLLLALFIVLFASSSIDKAKVEQMGYAFATAFSSGMGSGESGKIQNFIKDAQEADLGKDVGIGSDSKGALLEISSLKLFKDGSAVINPEYISTLKRIAALLDRSKYKRCRIVIEGHTDDRPIKNEDYPSNWELSTARAGAVVRELTKAGLKETRFQAIGMAGIAPKHPNYNSLGEPIPYNRERNNRLNIRIEM